MPRSDNEQQHLLPHSGDVQKTAKRSWDQFTEFALSDNVLEIAVGLM